MSKSRIPAEQASRFIKWLNFNPVSMQIRWWYSLRGEKLYSTRDGKPRHTRKQWLAYLRTLDLVPVRGLLHILWGELVRRPLLRWRRRGE